MHVFILSNTTGQSVWRNEEMNIESDQLVLVLTHWGRVTHSCVGKLTIIGSDNGLSPGRRQAIIWTNAGILSIGPLGTNFSEILIEIYVFSFKKMHLEMSSGKWRLFCFGLNVFKLPLLASSVPAHAPHTSRTINKRIQQHPSLCICQAKTRNGPETGGFVHARRTSDLQNETDIMFDTLRQRQIGRHLPDDIFKCIFVNENVWISINIWQACCWQYSSIGSDNGLAPNRRQAIIWTNDVTDCRRTYASLYLNMS